MHSKHSSAYSILVKSLVMGVALLMADVRVGAHIAFTSFRDGNGEIYVMDADGGNPRNLTRNPALDWGPHGLLMAGALPSSPAEMGTSKFT